MVDQELSSRRAQLKPTKSVDRLHRSRCRHLKVNDRAKSTLVQAISERLSLAKGLKRWFKRTLLPSNNAS
jgi:hypothetical protein